MSDFPTQSRKVNVSQKQEVISEDLNKISSYLHQIIKDFHIQAFQGTQSASSSGIASPNPGCIINGCTVTLSSGGSPTVSVASGLVLFSPPVDGTAGDNYSGSLCLLAGGAPVGSISVPASGYRTCYAIDILYAESTDLLTTQRNFYNTVNDTVSPSLTPVTTLPTVYVILTAGTPTATPTTPPEPSLTNGYTRLSTFWVDTAGTLSNLTYLLPYIWNIQGWPGTANTFENTNIKTLADSLSAMRAQLSAIIGAPTAKWYDVIPVTLYDLFNNPTIFPNIVPNGSFEFWSTTPSQWSITKTANNAAVISQGTGANSIDGQYSLNINTGSVAGLGGGAIVRSTLMPINEQDDYYIKFKTKADLATLPGTVTVSFYTTPSTLSIIGSPLTFWNPPTGAWPSAWSTYYGILKGSSSSLVPPSGVLAPTIPAGSKYFSISITGGSNGCAQNQNAWFDDVAFFTPRRTGLVLANTSVVGIFTFTTPSDCIEIDVFIHAAGGGGAAGDKTLSSTYSGGGGGAGAALRGFLPVMPNTAYEVTIGDGGTGAGGPLGGNGNPGADAYVKNPAGTVILRARGGQGGQGRNGGAGGSVAGTEGATYMSLLVRNGDNGGDSQNDGNNPGIGGNGAGVWLSYGAYVQNPGGNGGVGYTNGTNTPAQNGPYFGAGGGGGARGDYAYDGAKGAPGYIEVRG